MLAQRCLMVGLVVGIFSMSIPHLVLVALAASVVVFVCYGPFRPVHVVGIVVLLNYACWLISGAISGGLGWDSLISKEFWRGEGRCFLFYLPLLAFSVIRLRGSELRFLVNVVCFLTVVGAVLGTLWLLGWGHLFQPDVDAETGERSAATYFIGLQTSHTGAGAFWGTVTAFLSAYSLRTGQRSVQLLAILAALLTLGTGGRAATLGLVAVAVWLLVHGQLLNRYTLRLALPILLLMVLGGSAILVTVPKVSERMTEMFQSRTLKAVYAAAADEPTLKNASGHFHSGGGLEHHNLVIRVFLWKYALHLTAQSPVLGVGYGRFNDTNLEFTGIPLLVSLAVHGERYFGSGIRWEGEQKMTSTGNAHNSYLHILAETGIVGLSLAICLWRLMYVYCKPVHQSDGHEPEFQIAYCSGCRAAIVCLLVTALAGHALAAPSGGILLTTMIGAWLAYTRDVPRRVPQTPPTFCQ